MKWKLEKVYNWFELVYIVYKNASLFSSSLCVQHQDGNIDGKTGKRFGVFFGVFHPIQEFFTHMERHHYLCIFIYVSITRKLYIRYWLNGYWAVRVLHVPHLLWHGASVWNGHIRGSVKHTYSRAFGSGTVSTCFYGLGLLRLEFEHPAFRLRGGCSNWLPRRQGLNMVEQASPPYLTLRTKSYKRYILSR